MDVPFAKSGLYQVNGVRGGIVGYNHKGGLISDCSIGDDEEEVNTTYFMKVYDDNVNNSDTVPSNWDATEKYSLKKGNLYIGGIAGMTSGAIYNSYMQNANIFTKYYNGISQYEYDWNIYVGGIAGVQDVTTYSTGQTSSNQNNENLYSLDSLVT